MIKVAAAQLESKMGDKKYNLEKAIHYIDLASNENADIICFPETYYTGFDLTREEFREMSEKADGEMYQKLSKIAKQKKIHIIMPYPERIDISGVTFNSAMLIGDDGEILGNHRKVYLCPEEKGFFRNGNGYAVSNTRFGKIGMLICYEMEFPEPARILALNGAEILFVPTVFMGVHLMARYLTSIAIHNLIHVVAVNTIGNKRNGSSKILDQLGEVVKEASKDKEELLLSEINLEQGRRKDFPHMDDFNPKTLDWCTEAAKAYVNKYEKTSLKEKE